MSYDRPRKQPQTSPIKIRLVLAAVIVIISVLGYLSNSDINPVTGKPQRVGGISPESEITMGLQSVDQMVRQFDGLSDDVVARMDVEMMGRRLVDCLEIRLHETRQDQPYQFAFHLLNDHQTVNAFALPGGQVFITEALYRKLNEGQLAGVLGHEIGHVLERHSAQQLAKQNMFFGIGAAAGIATGDPMGQDATRFVTQIVHMKFGRTHELESDRWGVELMALAGYHPSHMIEVMDILESASGGGDMPEFLSTHPRPKNRRDYINRIIGEVFPYGVPEGLK